MRDLRNLERLNWPKNKYATANSLQPTAYSLQSAVDSLNNLGSYKRRRNAGLTPHIKLIRLLYAEMIDLPENVQSVPR